MAEEILNIALCVIIEDNRILLLKRKKNPYAGYLALPGGKIHFGETPARAALREAREETGLIFSQAEILGCAMETISAGEITEAHFIMFVVALHAGRGELCAGHEGELQWLNLAEIENNNQVIPTDIDLIKRYALSAAKDIVNYQVHRTGHHYELDAPINLSD